MYFCKDGNISLIIINKVYYQLVTNLLFILIFLENEKNSKCTYHSVQQGKNRHHCKRIAKFRY